MRELVKIAIVAVLILAGIAILLDVLGFIGGAVIAVVMLPFELILGLFWVVFGLLMGLFGIGLGLVGGAIGIVVGLIFLAIPILLVGLLIAACVWFFKALFFDSEEAPRENRRKEAPVRSREKIRRGMDRMEDRLKNLETLLDRDTE